MQKVEKLLPGYYYHIYNRGNNREDIFFEDKNYHYFLQLWAKYIEPVADTFAYCLMGNHFHFMVRMNDEKTFEVLETSKVSLSQPFSNLFSSYSKAINKMYNRTGSLFQTRFGRKLIDSENYFVILIYYIHFNPQKHGFVDDFREYPYSSYSTLLSDKKTKLKREQVIEWFGSKDELEKYHIEYKKSELEKIKNLIEDDE